MTVLYVVSYLTVHGCGLAGSAGIVANLQAESGLITSKIGPSGIGLAQWAGTRRRRLIATLGSNWSSAAGQLDYLLTELREFGLWGAVCKAADPSVAARVFMLKDERPRNHDPASRERHAREIYQEAVRWR